MKKIALALTALAALTGTASAADLCRSPLHQGACCGCSGRFLDRLLHRRRRRLRPLEPGKHRLRWTARRNAGLGPRVQATQTATTGGRGYFGTVSGGCDYQFALGSWKMVVGAFGDYDCASEKGNLNLPVSAHSATRSLTAQWAVGGRLGWLVTPQFLTYFSAGYTEAHFTGVNFNANLNPLG